MPVPGIGMRSSAPSSSTRSVCRASRRFSNAISPSGLARALLHLKGYAAMERAVEGNSTLSSSVAIRSATDWFDVAGGRIRARSQSLPIVCTQTARPCSFSRLPAWRTPPRLPLSSSRRPMRWWAFGPGVGRPVGLRRRCPWRSRPGEAWFSGWRLSTRHG